jgi:hypothetical protein
MKTVHLFWSVILVALLSACSPTDLLKEDRFFERSSPAFFVSDDPLNRAYFKMLANEAGIAYKRDYEGKYTAVKPKESSKLESLAKKAGAAQFSREKRTVDQTCGTRRLQGYLRENQTLFALVKDAGSYQLIMDAKDFSADRIEQRLLELEEICDLEAAEKAKRQADRDAEEGY